MLPLAFGGTGLTLAADSGDSNIVPRLLGVLVVGVPVIGVTPRLSGLVDSGVVPEKVELAPTREPAGLEFESGLPGLLIPFPAFGLTEPAFTFGLSGLLTSSFVLGPTNPEFAPGFPGLSGLSLTPGLSGLFGLLLAPGFSGLSGLSLTPGGASLEFESVRSGALVPGPGVEGLG